MDSIIDAKVKRLLCLLAATAMLAGCAAYGPADPYGGYPGYAYGPPYYYGPPSYYGPDIGFGFGYYGGDHDWRDGRGSGNNPGGDNGYPQARHGFGGQRERIGPEAGPGSRGDARGGRGDH